MVSVLPVSDSQRDGFCASHQVRGSFDRLFCAQEAGKEVGWFALREEADRLTVVQMELTSINGAPQEDRLLLDLMVRAAASYAANRLLPSLQCEEEFLPGFLQEMGFEKDAAGIYTISIQKLIHTCPNC